ncbi:MAG: tetratricopeptide repeat protein [Kofleriaceae bacterium]
MSAPAPAPDLADDPGPAASPDELATLRRRADEHASLLRSNQLALTQLTESVAAMVAGQRRRERGLNLNSFVAYALFTVLLGGGFYWLYRARVAELAAQPPRAGSVADPAAGAELESTRAALAARTAADREAYRLYQLGLAGERTALATGLAAAASTHTFSPTEQAALRAMAEPGPADVGEQDHDPATATPTRATASLDDAIDAYRGGDYPRAVERLRRVLAAEPGPGDAAIAQYYLGLALAKTGDDRAAVSALRAALAGDVKRQGILDTRYQLAVLHEKRGDLERARVAYDRFATENPQHALAMTARRRSAAITRPSGDRPAKPADDVGDDDTAAEGSATTP